MSPFHVFLCPVVLLILCHWADAQEHDLEELPYLGSDIRGYAELRSHLHCPQFPRPGEEVRITGNFYYQVKNRGNQPMRGFIDYSICDSLGNCENERKRYYVGPLGHKSGHLSITLVKRYGPEQGGQRLQAYAESVITGSVRKDASAMCYYTVRQGGYHDLRYDWRANRK